MQVGQDLNRWWKGGLTLCPLIEFLALNELNPANTARCGQLIVLWPRACVWNTTNARTTLEAIFWDATTILSRLTFFLEIFSILKMETSAWLSASKNVEKLVSCLLDSGKSFREFLRCTFCLRDRQFCHCGNVEPPTEFKVDLEKCGTSCPTTSNDLGIVEACGTTLHTMVSSHLFRANLELT